MTLYEKLTPKQKRTISRDIRMIFSLKGLSIPETIGELKEIGVFSPKITVRRKWVYFSESGIIALRRICDFFHHATKFDGALNYNDVFQGAVSEIERWLNDGFIPNPTDPEEFVDPLDSLLSKIIADYTFVCRVDGLSLDNAIKVNIGNKEIMKYSDKDISSIKCVNEDVLNVIKNEYRNSIVIIGSERGSKSVAEEKFYHNSNLALSVLRLYSCAVQGRAIHNVKIRLINNCTQDYGPASNFGWKNSERSLMFKRHLKHEDDLEIEPIQWNQFRSDFFFEKLSRLIDKQNRNELEEAVVKSLFWIGEAQNDRSHASAWVKLWFCLECFFSLGKNKITERNARGISSILVYGGYQHEDYADYEQVKEKITRYYSLRSKVVHRAEFIHIDEILLEELPFIVAWVTITIMSLLKRGFSTLSQVSEESERLDRHS